jgi:hypothetical protein
MTKYTKLALAAAAVAASMTGLNGTALAQSADALIDKLVDKGILSVSEANALREESDKNFTTAYSVKSGMPEWVTAFKINGDFRGRYEGFYADHPNFVERNRFRYRARLGFTALLKDNFEVGMRLGSGDVDSGVTTGLDPISNNQSLQNNASKKGIFLDLAYGKWTAVNNADWALTTTIGKMENPFVFSDMVFDGDYTPEGAAMQAGYNLSDKHALKMNAGIFVLDEIGGTTQDPFMMGAQGRFESVWSHKFTTSLGASYLTIQNPERLTSTAVPNINAGNSRTAGFAPLYDFTPFVADASATFTLDSFPMYKGAFPIKVGADYMQNNGAPTAADNDAWSAGITLGKAGKRGTWELAYTYKWLGANAWWEELTDSDFGAYYASAPLNGAAGGVAGYYAGTNVKGHIFKLAYSPTDALTLSAKLFLTDLINADATALTAPVPVNSQSDMTRIQVDAVLKF